MKTIFEIFKEDFKAVFSNVWAVVIIIGIMFIPALYAWFNINSNWDPYSATSGIKIAVANSDEGIKLEGAPINAGGMIVDKLAQNNKIGWQFVDEESARAGVNAGDYYAAVIIPKDFSKKVGSIASMAVDKPVIEYYANEKKNAIANKITETGINTVQVQVNQAIVETASSVIATAGKDTVDSVKDKKDEVVQKIDDVLNDGISSLENGKNLLSAVMAASDALNSSLQAVEGIVPQVDDVLSKASQASQDAFTILENSRQTADSLISSLTSALSAADSLKTSIHQSVDPALQAIDPAAQTVNSDVLTGLNGVQSQIQSTNDLCSRISKAISDLQTSTEGRINTQSLTDHLADLQDHLNALSQKIDVLIQAAQNGKITQDQKDQISAAASDLDNAVGSLQDVFTNEIQPNLADAFDKVDSQLSSLSGLGDKTSSLNVDGTFSSMRSALTSSNTSLNKTIELFSSLQDKIRDMQTDIETAQNNEKVQKVEELLERNPELVAAFMKQPVEIKTTSVYPIANYGSGMAPFYSVLAIWVGALVNCAIIRTRMKKETIERLHPSEDQMYFGRYLFFGFVAVCQSLIICLGDLYLLKIQCLHPFEFCFMGVVCGIVFSLLMYTLTISFGDVGKAIAIIIMVIQVAGSGGTYPIEVLPKFYQMLYPFFPFNYGINGMRECVAGMYGNLFWMDVFKELLFIPVSLIIGLALRKPIIRLKEYIESRIESTGIIG